MKKLLIFFGIFLIPTVAIAATVVPWSRTGTTISPLFVGDTASTSLLNISGFGNTATKCLNVTNQGVVGVATADCGSGGGGGTSDFSYLTVDHGRYLTPTSTVVGLLVPYTASSTLSKLTMVVSTTTEATTTYLNISTLASTSALTISGLVSGELGVNSLGKVYSGATTTAGTGLTYTGNQFNVNTSQNITTLSNLTSNGFVKTGGGVGTLSVDTSTYLTNVNIPSEFTYTIPPSITVNSGLYLTPTSTAVGLLTSDSASSTLMRLTTNLSTSTRATTTYLNVSTIASTSLLTVNGGLVSYGQSSTSTIPAVFNAWSLATSSTAKPILSVDGSANKIILPYQGTLAINNSSDQAPAWMSLTSFTNIGSTDMFLIGGTACNVGTGSLNCPFAIYQASGHSNLSINYPFDADNAYIFDTILNVGADYNPGNTMPAINVFNLGSTAGSAASLVFQALDSSNSTANYASIYGGVVSSTAGAYSGFLRLTTTNNAVAVDRLAIDQNGNVGIGTTSPASLLSVQGNALFSGNLTLANLTATGTITTPNFTLTGAATGCAQFTAGVLSSNGVACGTGSGAAYPFTAGLYGLSNSFATSSVGMFALASASSSIGVLSVGQLTATSTTASTSLQNTLLTQLQATGISTTNFSCSACIANGSLAQSTISGISLGSNLNSLTHGTTLNGTSYNGSAAVSDWALNLNNINNWTAAQSFGYSATTTYSGGVEATSFGGQYFTATSTTASSTFPDLNFTQGQGTGLSVSQLTVSASSTLQNTGFTGALFSSSNATSSLASGINVTSGCYAISGKCVDRIYPSINLASSTLAYIGSFSASGTTTLLFANYPRAMKMTDFYCITSNGTAQVAFGTGAATTSIGFCNTSGRLVPLSSANTWTARQTFYVEVGIASSSPIMNNVTITTSLQTND